MQKLPKFIICAWVETKLQAPFKSYLNTENPGDCNPDILELDIST